MIMKIMVKNAVNTAHMNPPDGSKSWHVYWQKHVSIFGLARLANMCCPRCGMPVEEELIDGAHVVIANDESGKMYICPLCKRCNQMNGEFEVEACLLVEIK